MSIHNEIEISYNKTNIVYSNNSIISIIRVLLNPTSIATNKIAEVMS